MSLRSKIRLLLLLPWPLLYLGYWSAFNVKGPASEGFGAGGYSSAIIATAFGVAFFGLNRAIVYANSLPEPTSLDRLLYFLAIALYAVGLVVLLPMIFFQMMGLPLSLIGILLVTIALLKWTMKTPEGSRNDKQD
ncbi:MAG: hypothetical protein KJO76_08390 [Gammaproteobacteria bacterium]|nr:hypothetical protein [Gammaproteobacteria bacterium]MBT8443942.1 hypothetical protein [Gammaproteobacteria bacterium]NND37475.1 hypothetical protein [Gammaproteobacteria bacterium]